MSTTQDLMRLARQVYRGKEPQIEWRRGIAEGRNIVIALVVSPIDLDAQGEARILLGVTGEGVGQVLERLERRLSAQVAGLPS